MPVLCRLFQLFRRKPFCQFGILPFFFSIFPHIYQCNGIYMAEHFISMMIHKTERMGFPGIQGNSLFYYVLDGIGTMCYGDGHLRCKAGQFLNICHVQRQQHEIVPIHILQPLGNCPARTHHVEKQLEHSIIVRIHGTSHAALYFEMFATQTEIAAMQIAVFVAFMFFQHSPVVTGAFSVPAFRFHIWFYHVKFCLIG